MVICLDQLMPLPFTVSCFSKIQIGFAFLVPAHPSGPGKGAVKRVCVCVCVTLKNRKNDNILKHDVSFAVCLFLLSNCKWYVVCAKETTV